MFKFIFSIIFALSGVCVFPLSAVVFYTIDTTLPLLCTFSSKYQNRVMVEKRRIQKVIAADEDRLSIFMEEISGQAFICVRDCNPAETTISIITETGLVQDLHLSFVERLPEVIILKDPELKQDPIEEAEEIQEKIAQNYVLNKIEMLLSGRVPEGYIPCSITKTQWKPKKGIIVETVAQLEGPDEILCVYQISNTLCKRNSLTEYELQHAGCRWIFLETNSLLPKQKIYGVIAVEK